MTEPRPTVFIVDDDPAVRESLARLMTSEGIAAEAFASADDFLSACDGTTPGCLLLDVRMPGMSGLELQAALARGGVDLPIIFLTAFADVPMAVGAIRAGAIDVLQKPVAMDELVARLRDALRLDAEARAHRVEREENRGKLERLTPREMDVLALVVTGMTNKRIAAELALSRRTVETHRANIMRKTGADSLPDLIHTAEATLGSGRG